MQPHHSLLISQGDYMQPHHYLLISQEDYLHPHHYLLISQEDYMQTHHYLLISQGDYMQPHHNLLISQGTTCSHITTYLYFKGLLAVTLSATPPPIHTSWVYLELGDEKGYLSHKKTIID